MSSAVSPAVRPAVSPAVRPALSPQQGPSAVAGASTRGDALHSQTCHEGNTHTQTGGRYCRRSSPRGHTSSQHRPHDGAGQPTAHAASTRKFLTAHRRAARRVRARCARNASRLGFRAWTGWLTPRNTQRPRAAALPGTGDSTAFGRGRQAQPVSYVPLLKGFLVFHMQL